MRPLPDRSPKAPGRGGASHPLDFLPSVFESILRAKLRDFLKRQTEPVGEQILHLQELMAKKPK